MKDNCAEMRATLDATKAKTRDLITQTNRLREEGDILASQETQLEAFVAKYQVWHRTSLGVFYFQLARETRASLWEILWD